jgi:Protein of unknown function (DUF4038)/Family of unknown function (DUF6298)
MEMVNLKSQYINISFWIFSILLSINSLGQSFNGTLRLNPENPRYFTDKSGKAIYLTGSHTWANFQEAGLPTESIFGWEKYLEMMKTNNHNFMKLWVWEQAKLGSWSSKEIEFSPLPYQQISQNGKVKYDLSKWNHAYFNRLRERVVEAGKHGIYVSVMLFQGWSQQKEQIKSGNPWLFHPFNPDNNINGIGKQVTDNKEDDAEKGTLHSIKNGDILKQQEAYVKKVIETINDLDNVLFEIINEGGTKDWQYHIINFIKKTEKNFPKQHPVGMSHAVAVTPLMWNQDLFESPADWIAPSNEPFSWNFPNSEKTTDYQLKIQPNNGKKVTVLDTDHLWGCGGTYQWIWKAFLQGYCPIFMDPWQNFPHVDTLAIKWLNPCLFEREYVPYKLARQNLGETNRFSKRINLSKSSPRPELSSTGFCLVEPNESYISWLESGKYLTLNLRNTTETFTVEWFNPLTFETKTSENVIGGNFVVLKSPFETESVLFLQKLKNFKIEKR